VLLERVAIMTDLSAPKMRIGQLAQEPVELKPGDIFALTIDDIVGDLNVEVPIERITIIQKDLMKQPNRRAKPVITATQVLESMTENRRPI